MKYIRSFNIDFTSENLSSEIKIGKTGEHNATQFVITPPAELSGDERTNHYRAAFRTGGKTYLSEMQTDIPFTISLWSGLTREPRLSLQVIAYDENGAFVAKSKMLGNYYFEQSIPDSRVEENGENSDIAHEISKFNSRLSDVTEAIEELSAEISDNTDIIPSLIAEVGTAFSDELHTHENKSVLDELSEAGGSLTYKGQAIGGSASGFYGECHSAAAVNAKEVTVDEAFELKDGVTVTVLFDYAARIGDTTAPQTLNVNGTGNKPMMIYAAQYQSGVLQISANTAVNLTYNANTGCWIYGGFFTADSIRYGFVKLSDAVNSPLDESYSVAATPLAVKTVNDALGTEITARQSLEAAKLNKNMGSENEGKILTVSSSGEITAAEITDIIPDADSEVY